MGLLDDFRNRFRAELPVRKEILEREAHFSSTDPDRVTWLLDHTYLSGDLDSLRKMIPGKDIAYYETPQGVRGPCKPVVVSADITSHIDLAREEAERKLKLDLHYRGANAGVFYITYSKDGKVFAQAVPATLTQEE